MSDTIESLLADRARAMAAHDGAPVGAVYIHAAANQLQVELLRARDQMVRGPPAAEASAEVADEEPVAEEQAEEAEDQPAAEIEEPAEETDATAEEAEEEGEQPAAEIEEPANQP